MTQRLEAAEVSGLGRPVEARRPPVVFRPPAGVRCLTFHLAVTRLNRVDVRLLVTLWFPAERWGRVTAEGVLLPLRLTHQILAQLIGARRPSVTTAVGELTAAGLGSRSPDGSWVPHGQPPDDLHAVGRRVRVASVDGMA